MSQFEIHDQVLMALRKIVRAIDLHSKSLVQKCGLTGPQLSILRELGKESPMSIGRLADRLSLSNATVTGIVDRMVQRKLLTKERSDEDRRRVMVEATKEGMKALEKAPSLLQEQFVQRLAQLEGWEQNLLLSQLQRVAHMMNAGGIDASPFLTSGPVDAPKEYFQDNKKK